MTTSEITGHAVAASDELPPGDARAFAVGDRMVAVFRLRSGELRAIDAVCPHSGGPLADGTCLNGDYAVRTYPVREESGKIVVDA